MPRKWTQDVVEDFRIRWRKGESAQSLARRYGVTARTIYERACRLNFGRRTFANEGTKKIDDPEIRRWFINNYPHMGNPTIAVFLEVGTECVAKYGRMLGLKKTEQCIKEERQARGRSISIAQKKRSGHKFSKEDMQEFVELYSDPRNTMEYLKKRYHTTMPRIRKLVAELGLVPPKHRIRTKIQKYILVDEDKLIYKAENINDHDREVQ